MTLESILSGGAAAAVSECAESSSTKSGPEQCLPEGQSRMLILNFTTGTFTSLTWFNHNGGKD